MVLLIRTVGQCPLRHHCPTVRNPPPLSTPAMLTPDFSSSANVYSAISFHPNGRMRSLRITADDRTRHEIPYLSIIVDYPFAYIVCRPIDSAVDGTFCMHLLFLKFLPECFRGPFSRTKYSEGGPSRAWQGVSQENDMLKIRVKRY